MPFCFQIPNLAIIVNLYAMLSQTYPQAQQLFSPHLFLHLIPSHFNSLLPKVVLSVTVHWRRLETCEAMEPPESLSRAIPVLSF